MERGPINNQFLLSAQATIFFSSSFLICCLGQASAQESTNSFPVGLILDMEAPLGKVFNLSISMAFEDFYASHGNHTTRVLLHTRDSKEDVIHAASAALDLMKNFQAKAIIGPTTSAQARFIVNLGNKTRVPIISFSATSPSLSHAYTPYFIRTSVNDSMQADAIADVINYYGWKQVVPIYEDTEYGAGILPFLTDALFLFNAKVSYHSIISPSASDDQIIAELKKLMSMQGRVFVVNMAPSLASRLFIQANKLRMIDEGYAWLVTDGTTTALDSLEPKVIESMKGVLGFRPYVEKTEKFNDFSRRWTKRFQQTNPGSGELNVYALWAYDTAWALWAYDTAWALAMAVEKVGHIKNKGFTKASGANKSTDLDMLGTSLIGPELLKTYLDIRFDGTSGEFRLKDGQLQASVFHVLNVNERGGRGIGFWKLNTGLCRSLTPNSSRELGPVIWPGEAKSIPKGWEIPANGKEISVGVPMKDGFDEFVKVVTDPHTNTTSVSGYCINVFEEALRRLPYAIKHKYIPFVNSDGKSAGSYDELVNMVYLKKYDAVVGDVTIIANRSQYVDFTLPFTESGVMMTSPIRKDESSNTWIFIKPWTADLWLATFGFFFLTGFVVWVIEHRINPEFRGPPSQQAGIIFYFAFSTLVFAHKEKVLSNLARFALLIWFFVVLILTSSYTASLTSFLTTENLRPAIASVDDLLKNGDCVGYQDGSFVFEMLKHRGFQESKLKPYGKLEEYVTALSQGSQGGGVAAIFDEIAYIKLLLSKHSANYTMVGPSYKTNGFGFVFPKGSPLVPDFSRAVLDVTQGEGMRRIEQKWFGKKLNSKGQHNSTESSRLSFKNFRGLFLLTGITSGIALILYFIMFVYHNREEMRNIATTKSSVGDMASKLAEMFDKKDPESHTFRHQKNMPEEEDIEGSFQFSVSSPSNHAYYIDQSPIAEISPVNVVDNNMGSPTTSPTEVTETRAAN